jgi:hypothetical protein
MSKAPNAFPTSTQETLAGYSVALLPRAKINTSRWDKCIENALNESPLAYSWVLDHLSPNWMGLILGNYDGIMPLPARKQFGLNFIQMPEGVLTLGLFSNKSEIISLFPGILNHSAFSKYHFINYNGAIETVPTSLHQGSKIKQTYELNLSDSYKNLYRHFSQSHKRNIKHFHSTNLKIDSNPGSFVYTSLLENLGKKRPELFMSHTSRIRIQEMTHQALNKNMGKTYSVWENDNLIGGAFFLIGNKRIIAFHLANARGRFHKTSFAIIDKFIQEHSEQEKTLDFAGSVIPNVATFNHRFGATPANYLAVTINKLPQPLKWAKEKNLLFNLKRLFFK